MASNRNKFRNKNLKFKSKNGNIKGGGIKKRLVTRKNTTDARQKLMQKKRVNVKDAREVLSNLSRRNDARDRLEKLRKSRTGGNATKSGIRAIGSNIVQTTDKNGKIALITKKSKNNTSNISLAIKEQLGILPARKKSGVTKKSPPTRNIPNKISNLSTPLRRTILNNANYMIPNSQFDFDDFDRPFAADALYKWIRPNPRSDLDRMSERMLYSRLQNNWSYPSNRHPRVAQSSYIDLDKPMEDEEMPLIPMSPVNPPPYRASILSRLDSHPSQTQSHGIFSNSTNKKIIVPVGHRIVVSNLQPSVTQEDIRELFEDIGQLLVARLVRPGTAEVIYKNLKDAQKAVDTYHNRQLDGQPMKCLLVNKRPLNNPTGAAIPSPDLTTSKTVSNISSQSEGKIVPDIQTIHKVLFRKGD